mmetsp:Transcript_1425/g.5391  ORF Transcript_1425/g.5391 Transcript_1425/m.5391 type:complete len:237 (-) Transcript_1425:30-740(-)
MTPFMSICSPLPCFSLTLERRRPTTPTSPSRSTASPVPSSSKNTLLRFTAEGMKRGTSPGRFGVDVPAVFSACALTEARSALADCGPSFLGVGVLGLVFATGSSSSSSPSPSPAASSSSSSISIGSSSTSASSLSSSSSALGALAGGDLTIFAGVDFISNFSSVLCLWKKSMMPSSLSSSALRAWEVGDLKLFIQSGSSRSPGPSLFAGIRATGRAKSGRSSSLSSSMTIGMAAGH